MVSKSDIKDILIHHGKCTLRGINYGLLVTIIFVLLDYLFSNIYNYETYLHLFLGSFVVGFILHSDILNYKQKIARYKEELNSSYRTIEKLRQD